MAQKENGYRNERLQVMLDENELNAIDEWRFRNRMPSRAAAIRELIRRGLLAQDVEEIEDAEKSEDYGVLND